MRKLLLVLLTIGIFSIIYISYISLRNNLSLIIRSDFPIHKLDIKFYVNGSLVNTNDIFSIENQFDIKSINSYLWINNYSYQIKSKSKIINYRGNIFLYKDKIIELYFLDDSLSNEYIIREVNRIKIE